MDNLDESENNAKVSDSAYSNSCSNSQSRRSHCSYHSGSHSSRSSGYGEKQSNGSSNNLCQPSEKWKKIKNGKKKKKVQNDIVELQEGVEFRLPKPTSACQIKDEVSDVLPESPILVQGEKRVEDDKKVDIKSCDADGFSCIISMHDGVVVYASTSLTDTLGFPKEMWIGRSFIDFIHPLDQDLFASQIMRGVAHPKKVNVSTVSNGNSTSTMYCRIRRFRKLTTGFGVKEQTISFMPFMLELSSNNINDERGKVVIYLVIQATPQFSAFKTTHEIVAKPMPFVIRHISNGNLEYYDYDAIPLLGYLPQDVTGKDVLRLYHPDDLVYIRQVYETMVKEGGAPRSKPYRFMAQNGHYLKLETEFSSFMNPWSRKLEFVIAKHHVVEGPENPDVFQPPIAEKTTNQAKNKVQGLRDSIVTTLNEVLTKPEELTKQQISKRCQDLVAFMESLLQKPSKLHEELRLEISEIENSYYERDSVMLGGISPHHDYDSKSSTNTPVSYNQLNFNENLQRYFNSHRQISYDDYHDIQGSVTPKDATTFSGGCMSPMAQQSGDSPELTSSGESTGAAVVETSTNLPRLTTSLLNKHNSEMEKSLVMQHRECRTTTKENREKAAIDKQKKKDHLSWCNTTYLPTLEAPNDVDPQPHGQKRASTPLEGEAKSHKHHCTAPPISRQRMFPTAVFEQSASNATSAAMSQWQQGPATAINPYGSNISMSQQLSIMSSVAAVPGVIPMLYVPTPGPALPSTSEMGIDLATTAQYAISHLQYMMYGQAIYGAPVVMSPGNGNAHYPIQQHNPTSSYSSTHDSLGLTASNYEEVSKSGLHLNPGNPYNLCGKKERTTEMATSSKKDQGSGNSSSICSTSNALNGSMKAVPKSFNSADSMMKAPPKVVNSQVVVDRTDGESSYSSFYSSFFKTDTGSGTDSGDAKKDKNGANLGVNGINQGSTRDNKVTRRKREPPWMEQVCVTSELVYKYQMLTKTLTDVLTEDKQKIMSLQQPSMVNDQLGQLYMDMDLEGVAARLTLEEEATSSGSSEEAASMPNDIMSNISRRKRRYGKLAMIYEEDSPIPPPCGAGGDPEDSEPEAPLET